MPLTESEIFAIERPHPRLMWLYVIRSILTGPLIIISLPILFFRYETLRYRFDAEGIHMRWGILFRRQINLTYARIQDIHMTSGLIQRWLGLADLKIQTASGSTGAEMTIEGLMEFEAIRDFLYMQMRGYREQARHRAAAPSPAAPAAVAGNPQVLALMQEVVVEMRATRQALERLGRRDAARDPQEEGPRHV